MLASTYLCIYICIYIYIYAFTHVCKGRPGSVSNHVCKPHGGVWAVFCWIWVLSAMDSAENVSVDASLMRRMDAQALEALGVLDPLWGGVARSLFVYCLFRSTV